MRFFNYPHLLKVIVVLALFIGIGSAVLPVGGRISSIIHCANGQLLKIGPPRPGIYLFSFGSRLFQWFSIRSGNWVLGIATPGGACVCPNGNCEVGAIPAQGTLRLIGTSR